MNRRRFLFASFTVLLAACARRSEWPEGMERIVWDRDTCARCKMVISDRRFAVEARGGPKGELRKFDDIGCALFWLREQGWDREPSTRIWVADAANRPQALTWLDAKTAHYTTRTSPMGYNFGATALPQAVGLSFDEMRDHVLARGR